MGLTTSGAKRAERRILVPMDRQELAWAAGLFDGEGHVRTNGPRRYPTINIKQAGGLYAAPEVLERFRRAVGYLGYLYGPVLDDDEAHRPQWNYDAHGFETVQMVLCALWPWLGPVKRAQFVASLRGHLQIPAPKRNPGVRVGRPLRETCPRGHDYSDVYLDTAGRRSCRPCRRERSANFYRRQRAYPTARRLRTARSGVRPRPGAVGSVR